MVYKRFFLRYFYLDIVCGVRGIFVCLGMDIGVIRFCFKVEVGSSVFLVRLVGSYV